MATLLGLRKHMGLSNASLVFFLIILAFFTVQSAGMPRSRTDDSHQQQQQETQRLDSLEQTDFSAASNDSTITSTTAAPQYIFTPSIAHWQIIVLVAAVAVVLIIAVCILCCYLCDCAGGNASQMGQTGNTGDQLSDYQLSYFSTGFRADHADETNRPDNLPDTPEPPEANSFRA